ncbi:MAG: ATP-binding cassette domain-containing protein [Proteobacteria bacterium]|nr:ATP-binding cassette domain-containing protein [Pseudomonadota bacterium]
MNETEYLVQAKNLSKLFKVKASIWPWVKANTVKAVVDVSVDIRKGETLGIVGESGCGKSTFGLTLIRLHEATSGQVVFDGVDLFDLNKAELMEQRQNMQVIFQDPYSSLNPRKNVYKIISEPLSNFNLYTGKERSQRIDELIELVGLNPDCKFRYPHEFSGGQRQRIGIARALATNPKFVVCDESVSALDVSIQAQILNLLVELKNKLGLTYLFISHDLLVVNHIADRIAVMYLGKVVEISDNEALFENPRHPYTQALLSCVPIPDPELEETRERILPSGEVPSPMNPPSGCYFHPRCHLKTEECERRQPELRPIGKNRSVACHVVD